MYLFGDYDNRFNGYAIEAFEKFAHIKIDDSDKRVWEIARQNETVPNFSEIYNHFIAEDIENFFSEFCPGLIEVKSECTGSIYDNIVIKSVATGDTLEIDASDDFNKYDFESIVKLSYHQVMMDAIIDDLEALERNDAVADFDSEYFIDNVLSNEPDFYDDIKDSILEKSFRIKQDKGFINKDELEELIKDCAIDALENLDEYKEIIAKAKSSSLEEIFISDIRKLFEDQNIYLKDDYKKINYGISPDNSTSWEINIPQKFLVDSGLVEDLHLSKSEITSICDSLADSYVENNVFIAALNENKLPDDFEEKHGKKGVDQILKTIEGFVNDKLNQICNKYPQSEKKGMSR